jgi:hypothetical protein
MATRRPSETPDGPAAEPVAERAAPRETRPPAPTGQDRAAGAVPPNEPVVSPPAHRRGLLSRLRGR